MSLAALLGDVGRKAADAVRSAAPDAAASVPRELPVVKAGKPEFGDFQISALLGLAKQLKRPPRELADAVVRALAGHPSLAKVEVAGPGFVNLHLTDDFFARAVEELGGDERLGLTDVGAGTTVVLDYSSPNVAKPMHIGHIRSTIIGAALDRVLRALGYRVIADNHLGDWGTQFGKLIVAYRRWLDADGYAKDPVAELLRLYTRFNQEEKRERAAMGQEAGQAQAASATSDGDGAPGDEDEVADAKAPPILEEARRELVKLQAGDADNRALWQQFIADSRHAFQSVYDRLGVRFDHWLGESFYNDRLAGVVARLVDEGIARDSRGAVVVFFDEQGEVLPRDREPVEKARLPPFIVRKSDGGFNYATTDIATMLHRTNEFGARRILIVTDERQQLHFKQLFAVGRRLGVQAELEHVWFGLMRMPEGTIKTREGNVIHLADLLDEAERRAAKVAKEKDEALDGAALAEVARVVGLGALQYNDLSKDRQTLVTFTWDKALSLEGNTAPYLQYAYARIRSIQRKAAEEGAPPSTTASTAAARVVLGTRAERDLAKRLLAYPEAVQQVARAARPHILAEYLYDLATALSAFYPDHPVLKAEADVRASRLALIDAVARTLRHGLGLLGIAVLERM